MGYEFYGILLHHVNDYPFPGEIFFPAISATAKVSFSILYQIVTHPVAFIRIYTTANLAVIWVHEWYKYQLLQTVHELEDRVTVLQPRDVEDRWFTVPLYSSSRSQISSHPIVHRRLKNSLYLPEGYSLSVHSHLSVQPPPTLRPNQPVLLYWYS